jgi:hypothetical protein
MLAYLQSPKFQQLLAENPEILVGVAGWITITLVMSLLCLSQWFSVRITHNHHYHYPASATENLPQPEVKKSRSSDLNDPATLKEWLNRNFPGFNSPDTPPVTSSKSGKMSKEKRFAILRRDGFRCCICGLRASEDENLVLHVDHRLPRAAGGTDDEENLWTLCQDCNLGKSDQIVAELLSEADKF